MRIIRAALENEGGLRLRHFLHGHDFRNRIDELALFVAEPVQFFHGRPSRFKTRRKKVIEELLALYWCEFFFCRRERVAEIDFGRNVSNFDGTERAIEHLE